MCSPEGDASEINKTKKLAEIITSLKNKQSDQGPVNPLFNKEPAEKLLPQVVDNWDVIPEDTKQRYHFYEEFLLQNAHFG